ncbi:MAG: pyrroline-5-carboxylate reductase [Candidatus Glassbacteria bacterium]|nr:pyrroline-5-carboxylate reductase [Candidatus Glassbacteria bacterium]
MSNITPLGFIGAGKMGASLIAGVIRAGVADRENILISEPDSARRDELCADKGIRAADSVELARNCPVIVLAVKPGVVADVLDEISAAVEPGKTVISIAAGIKTGAMEEKLADGVAVVRAMPNIAATVGESATAIAAGKNAGREALDAARRVLGAAGSVVELPEKLIDAVTGLAGSGPAYVFTFVEALIAAGLKVGLPAEEARKLAVQTVKGAAVMLEQREAEHPAELRDAVTTPGGTTIAGLHELESGRFTDVVIRAVEAAARRSRELGD